MIEVNKLMNELEVRFELNDERDYNNAISYLEKSYKFKCENKQVDEYFKTKDLRHFV